MGIGATFKEDVTEMFTRTPDNFDPLNDPHHDWPRCSFCGDYAIWVDEEGLLYCPSDGVRLFEPRFPSSPGLQDASTIAQALLAEGDPDA